MRKFATAIVLALALALAACGGGGSGSANSNTLTMSGTDFTPSNPTVTIKAGQSVKFVDQNGTHVLATGLNTAYQADANAPAQLNTATGLRFNAGDSQTITFANPGTYHITCLVHQSMNATVVVTP